MDQLSLSEVFGVDTDIVDLWDVLRPGQKRDGGAEVDSVKKDLKIPTGASVWVDEMMRADPDDVGLYFQSVPEPRDALVHVLNRKVTLEELIRRQNGDILHLLEEHVPGWLTSTSFVLDLAVRNGEVEILDYLLAHYPSALRDTMGLTKRNGHPGVLEISDEMIDTSLSTFNFSQWGKKDIITVSSIQKLGKIWPEIGRFASDAVASGSTVNRGGSWDDACLSVPSRVTGAQRFMLLLENPTDVATSQWICTHVREVSEYLNGNASPWEKALRRHEQEVTPTGKYCLGPWFFGQVMRAISPFVISISTERGKDTYREWLNHPILRSQGLFNEFVPEDGGPGQTTQGIATIPGLIDTWTGRIEFLLTDSKTAKGMGNLIRRYCRQQRVASKLVVCPREWEAMTGSQDRTENGGLQGGLVEAALWETIGAVKRQLFQTKEGVAMVQQVLSAPQSANLIQRVGDGIGWQNLEMFVKEHADLWQNWRDSYGNNITHWLAFGMNKIDLTPRAKFNRGLGSKFPALIIEANNQGYSPTYFMPRSHADAIAAKIIRKTGKRTKAEQGGSIKRRQRAI